MKPIEIAARFAAFTWYTNCRQAKKLTIHAEARRFSNQNWRSFLPVAQKGIGGDPFAVVQRFSQGLCLKR